MLYSCSHNDVLVQYSYSISFTCKPYFVSNMWLIKESHTRIHCQKQVRQRNNYKKIHGSWKYAQLHARENRPRDSSARISIQKVSVVFFPNCEIECDLQQRYKLWCLNLGVCASGWLELPLFDLELHMIACLDSQYRKKVAICIPDLFLVSCYYA